ncbi:type-F conjugative transfer system mating-pair stabilization protein TraN [Symbiopectobacterium purcellii]|uniref:type-F conjugative transfer system mating-pair stabilization protein TraN n=1 Tax=Symbiopectobacterium purcellii TaxID=2871826 RepID=UPI003F83ABFF
MSRVCLVSVAVLLMAGIANANAQTDADAQYKAGADFAREIKGKGDSSLNNFNPGNSIPNYTDSPGEKNYYGGVKATSDGTLKTDGGNAWSQTEAGKAVTDSMMKNPKEPILPDAPFIQSGKDVQSRADTIIGKTGQMQCEAQQINRSEFTNYSCERDVQVERACTRTAELTGGWSGSTEQKSFEVTLSEQPFNIYGGAVHITITPPVSGKIIRATYRYPRVAGNQRTDISVLGTSLYYHGWTEQSGTDFWPSQVDLVAGQPFEVSHGDRKYKRVRGGVLIKHKSPIPATLHFDLQVDTRIFTPRVAWTEHCPFNKDEGRQSNTECLQPGGERTLSVEGKQYSINQACWQFKDTYITQLADGGSCQKYMGNPACTLASRTCAFNTEDGGGCLHEYVSYSCETRTTGKVMICGGDTFCLDGECESAQQGKNNDFAPVVSALAALAAAGKDVAALNGVNVRAFTGSAKFCKKFAVGFSNCCKDSGWGQDIGIASCSTEEKALGKAKEKQLTVSVGEFCSKKVLGVCLEKKRGYCQFDSKLAQIVQQQGRNGQLRIGFGAAKSPDCRGITQTELQQIKFDNIDFSNFFEDLQKNQKIPDNNALTERVREQIATQLQNK